MISNPTFPSELQDLEKDLARFSASLQQFADRLGLNLAALEADHIAVRCHQNSTAERWKEGLLKIGTLFSEAMINGRPVCLFKLHQPLLLNGWQLDVIELPWPGRSAIATKALSMWKLCCAAITRRWACARWRCLATMR